MKRERISVAGVMLMLALPAMFFVGCGDDDDPVGKAGAGGKAGRGGTAGKAGSGGGSGTGGSGGTSGKGGTGGGGTGGSVGTGGGVGQGGGGAGGVAGGDGSVGAAGTAGQDGGAGSSGADGSVGSGGTAGQDAGSAGADGSVGSAGTAGSDAGGSDAADAATESCTGCARLSVPLAGANDRAHFIILNSPLLNLSATTATITFRVFVRAGTRGSFQGYVQHGANPDGGSGGFAQFFQGWQELSNISGFQNIVWNIGSAVTSFDKTVIERIGIEITGSDTKDSGAWTNPTIVYVDSILVSNGPSFTFDTSGTISSSTTNAPAGVMFLNSFDGPVAGSQVTWLGP